MCACKKQNWKAVFFISAFIVCFALFTQSAPRKVSPFLPYDTADMSSAPVGGAPSATSNSQGTAQKQGMRLENQESLLKEYDLDKLLHRIQTVLEHNSLENTKQQFHRFFDKKDSAVYSCPSYHPPLNKQLQTIKDIKQNHTTTNDQNNIAHGKSDGHENDPKEAHNRLEKIHEENTHTELHQAEDLSLLTAKTLYKKGYDFILSANYVEAEKAFCVFQDRYREDPLSGDALFWLAEALLGQKRYHDAAQVYLAVWYTDKKTLYGSEILLKLAISMAALGQNKEACALFSNIPKRYKSLECAFCKRLEKERSRSQCSLD
ncbi:tetratricopeptide repeat protein [Bartonella doshiae]|uniref:tetratricopeptide repeat protein n=1 Tax=Bartonella doshiae TaxID=33044 RepID=UPI000AEEB5F2|nr:tetratricopeptide repeat protein [Bartonella doshiae]